MGGDAWSCWVLLIHAIAWAFLEQLVLAVLDIGQLDLVDVSMHTRCGGWSVDCVF